MKDTNTKSKSPGPARSTGMGARSSVAPVKPCMPQLASKQVTQSTSTQAFPPGLVCPARATADRHIVITQIATANLNLLISSSVQSEVIARRAIAMAEAAYSYKRHGELHLLGQRLSSIERYRFIGSYYQGLAALKNGNGNLEHAFDLLGQASEYAPAQYAARAILSLGAVEAYKGNLSGELRQYERVFKSQHVDYFTRIETARAVALAYGLEGDHERAVDQLEALYPVAKQFARFHPRLYFDLLNSLAVEYAECGRISEARAAIQPVINSALARSITEYQETAREIGARASQARIIVPVAAEPKKVDAVHPVPAFARSRSLLRPVAILRDRTIDSISICILVAICAPIRAPAFMACL